MGRSVTSAPCRSTISPRERCVLAGIDRVEAATHAPRSCAPSACKRAAMRGGVDAEREPAGDGEPGLRQVRARTAWRCRGRARSDCGCRRSPAAAGEQRHGVAFDEQHQRRVRDLRQQRRVVRRAPGDEPSIRCGLQPAQVAGDRRRSRVAAARRSRLGPARARRARRAIRARGRSARRPARASPAAALRAGPARARASASVRVVHAQRAYRGSLPAGSCKTALNAENCVGLRVSARSWCCRRRGGRSCGCAMKSPRRITCDDCTTRP